MNVENPRVDIVFADHHIEAIQAGSKTHTIRLGWRNYKPGPTVIGCPIAGWAMHAYINSVQYTTASYVDVGRYGYIDKADFLESMRRYYPDFNENSQVTIIHFELT